MIKIVGCDFHRTNKFNMQKGAIAIAPYGVMYGK